MMFKKTTISALFLSSFLLASVSIAADLTNNDDVTYTLYVENDDGAVSKTIGPNETIPSICTDCYIEIDETGDGIVIEEEAKVIIKDGKFVVEE